MRINQAELARVRKRIELGCPGYTVEVKHLGDHVWLAKADFHSPFLMADAIERALGCQIDLDWTDPGQLWKASGCWRGYNFSYVRFWVPSEVMANVFVQEPAAPLPPAADQVYFVDDGDHIKIGRSSKPISRIGHLQASSGKQLTLLLTMPNGNRERQLHRQFAHLRISGEWFEKGPDLMEFIATETRRQQDAQALVNSSHLSPTQTCWRSRAWVRWCASPRGRRSSWKSSGNSWGECRPWRTRRASMPTCCPGRPRPEAALTPAGSRTPFIFGQDERAADEGAEPAIFDLSGSLRGAEPAPLP